jgi:hypothetical protein
MKLKGSIILWFILKLKKKKKHKDQMSMEEKLKRLF